MRIQKKIHYLLFASLLMIFSSCDLSEVFDDEDDMDDPEAEIVTAKINGEAFSAVESDDALIQLDQVEGDLDLNGDVFELSFTATDFGQSYLTTLSLSLQGLNYSDLKAGSQFVGFTEENLSSGNPTGAAGVVAKASLDGETEFAGITLLVGTIEVELTKLDKENELMSGEFSFVAYDDDNDTNIVVTEGVFTNVEF
ncbi:MAG: hypothetical protein GYB55_03200 [Cytophagales bacterium]|uniref:hypothetical protein n=1 Tax=Cyclobacterium marinum TaxID=104 RepID=UPI0030DADF4E|nr:hypothetical protein [Cytophagales bacterium]|tara:strand:- start:32303 stop:32893 length:591 start_codon:yes stop_codon:yes gene_type:complete